MYEQITMQQAMNSRFYDRKGRLQAAPDWVNDERCGNCQYWQLLPECDQPPCGWGVKGLCGGHRSQNRNHTSQTSYCQDYREVIIG